MKSVKSWFGLLLVLALMLGACGYQPPGSNRQVIAGVTCTTKYLGQVIRKPDTIANDSLGFFYQPADGTVEHYHIWESSTQYPNLLSGIHRGETLYSVEFSETASKSGYSTAHVVFFPSQPTAEQILPYIPEKARVQPTPIPTPAPTPTVITPEKEPGK